MGRITFRKRYVVFGLVFIAAVYWLFFSNYRGAPDGAAIPNRFKVIESKFTLGTNLTIVADGLSYGSVSKEWYNPFKTSFDIKNQSGAYVAHASKALLSWGTKIVVSDGDGHFVGEMEKKVISSWLGMGATNVYEVYDYRDKRPLVSDGVKVGVTTFTLRAGTNGPIVAQLYRSPWSFFHDSWEVEVIQPGAIDQRVLVMIAAFKTASDNDKQ